MAFLRSPLRSPRSPLYNPLVGKWGLFGAGTAAGALLGNESSGIAVDFANNSALVRGHTTNFLGAPADLFSVTRSTTGTYFDSSGVLQTASANTLRLDHDPATGEALGLLVEPQRANLLLNSETLSTQSVTVTAAAHTLSFYGTGTVTLSGTSTAGPLVGTGADTPVSLTFTPTAGSLTLTVTGTVSMANLEVGSYRTSFIPTAGISVTRAADQVSLATSKFPLGSAHTLIVEASAIRQTGYGALLQLGDGTANERIDMGSLADDGFHAVRDNNVEVAVWPNSDALNVNVYAGEAFVKTALAAATNDANACVNGVLGTADTAVTMPTPTTLFIGYDHLSRFWGGHIRSIVYLPRRLADANLQARTA